MEGHLYQPFAQKPQLAFRQKPLNELQDQSSRRFMTSLWDFLFFRAPCRVTQRGANIFRREVGVKLEDLLNVGT
jgi:hypothetical protein